MQQNYFVPKYIFSFITFISLGLLTGLTGCTTTSLQNLAVEGPLFQPPVHTVEDSTSSVHVHPWITTTLPQTKEGRVPGHTLVNSHGIFYVDTNKGTTPYQYTEQHGINTNAFQGSNFSWQLPQTQYGLDMDFRLNHTSALCVGGGHSSLNDESFWQVFGMLSTLGDGVRLDAGVEWQTMNYTVDFVHSVDQPFNSYNNITFFNVHNHETQFNQFFALTLNGTSSTSALTLFLQAALVRQTLFYISDAPESSSFLDESHETHYIYSLSPGINIHLTQNISTLLGVRFIWDAGMDSKTTTTFQPLLQFDIGL